MSLIRDIAKSVEAWTVEVNESIAKVSVGGSGNAFAFRCRSQNVSDPLTKALIS